MPAERPQTEQPRVGFMDRLHKLRARHRTAVGVAREYEQENPSDPEAVDLSRRRLLFAGGMGAGAVATSLLERNVLGLESTEDEWRKRFTNLVDRVKEVKYKWLEALSVL